MKSISAFVLVAIIFMNGCASEWNTKGSFFQKTQAEVAFKGTEQSKLFLNNELKGMTPVTLGIDYEQEYIRKQRNVSYWHTHPGLTLILSIITLGIYLPFSAIPADNELMLDATETYNNNEFTVRYEKTGCIPAQQKLILGKERRISFEMQLLCTN